MHLYQLNELTDKKANSLPLILNPHQRIYLEPVILLRLNCNLRLILHHRTVHVEVSASSACQPVLSNQP